MYWQESVKKVAVALGGSLLTYLLFVIAQKITLAYDTHLSKIPGPKLSAFTNIPLKLAVITGKRTFYIHDLHQKYGPVVRITPNEVAIADIQSCQKIHRVGTDFRKGAWYQQQSPTQHSDETCGVFGLRGLKNAKLRRKYFLQAGTRSNVTEWEPRIKDIVHRAVAKIKRDAQNGNADLLKWWFLMTADVVGEVAFGEEFGMLKGEKKTQMIMDVEDAMFLIGMKMELPWFWSLLSVLPIPSVQKIYTNINRFDDYGALAVKNAKLASHGRTKTMFSKMCPEDGTLPLPDIIVQREAMNLIIAGVDTTTMTLVYLIYSILSHEKVKQRLIAELKTCSAAPDWQELEGLAYLNAVINESMRVNAAIPASLPRTVPQRGAMLGEYFIPEEITVSTQCYTLHRDPNVWPEPERFNPDRWLDPTPEMKEHFMAWGGSARFCLGQNIARVQLLHAVHAFFTELPNARLLPSATKESMEQLEFFVAKPKGGKCEITAV